MRLKHGKKLCDSMLFRYFTVELQYMMKTASWSRGEIQHFSRI